MGLADSFEDCRAEPSSYVDLPLPIPCFARKLGQGQQRCGLLSDTGPSSDVGRNSIAPVPVEGYFPQLVARCDSSSLADRWLSDGPLQMQLYRPSSRQRREIASERTVGALLSR